jgi:FtsZ-binding cell division protein ZapB
MSFLRPASSGRNGHEAAAAAVPVVEVEPAPPPASAPPDEAHARVLGVMSAELDRLRDAYADSLAQAQARLDRALADLAAMQRRNEELEREHAEAQRRVRALRHLLDD